MRIFFSVGEPSGDTHGANLIRDLRARMPGLEAVGFGGPKMEAAGFRLLHDLTTLAVMGVWNVLLNVRRFLGLLAEAREYLASHEVDAVVLIDYPGFNWWVARAARRRGIPVFYYGVPQMWAWLPGRVRKLKRLVQHVLCKLPFEETWFARKGCRARYVGHPFFDELVRHRPDESFVQSYQNPDRPLVVLLPGSRTQEVRRNLPVMLDAVRLIVAQRPGTSITIASFSAAQAEYANDLCRAGNLPIDVVTGRTQELMSMADVCIACSGSVSLELLYHRKPAVIVYRVDLLTWCVVEWILRKCQFITLVNLVATGMVERDRKAPYRPDSAEWTHVPMPEYFTWRNPAARIAPWIVEWLSNPQARRERMAMLEKAAAGFAIPGASERAAQVISDLMHESQKRRNENPDRECVSPAPSVPVHESPRRAA